MLGLILAAAVFVQDTTLVDSTVNVRVDTTGWNYFYEIGVEQPPDSLPTSPSPPLPYAIDSTDSNPIGLDSALLTAFLVPPLHQLDSMDAFPNIQGGFPGADGRWVGNPGPVLYQFKVACADVGASVPFGGRTYANGDERSVKVNGTIPVNCATGPTPPDTTPPPVIPPPGAGDVFLDFNDPNTLGVNCGGNPCNWPYRKHTWDATGGINGSGAILMHWQTGMGIGYSPVFINTIVSPTSRHYAQTYMVRQNAIMDTPGSNVKLNRMRLGSSTLIGSLLSGGGGSPARPVGGWAWVYDDYNNASRYTQLVTPFDDQWHEYKLIIDYHDEANLLVEFYLDDVLQFQRIRPSAVGDLWSREMSKGLILSPFVEMFSCGNTGCQAQINTGDYWVDNFTYTVLP